MKPVDSITRKNAPSPSTSGKQVRESPKKKKSSTVARKSQSVSQSINKSIAQKAKKRGRNSSASYSALNLSSCSAVHMMVGSRIFKISAKVLREIEHYQASVSNLIPRLPFARLIQEILMQYVPEGMRIQKEVINALQESAECYLAQYFEDSYACTLHARRCTLIPRDMALVEFLRKTA